MKKHTVLLIVWLLFIGADTVTYFSVPRTFRHQWDNWPAIIPGGGFFVLAQFNREH